MLGYTKTITGGTDDCIILDPREQFIRETSLPLTWTKCRIGLMVSFTTLASDNADPTNTTLSYTGALDQISIGISNGVAAIGQTGNRYVGFGRLATGTIPSPYVSGAAYHFAQVSTTPAASVIGDGGSLVISVGANSSNNPASAPSGLSTYAQPIVVDITLGSTSATAFLALLSGVTDVSSANLRAKMQSSTPTSLIAATGGWWNGGSVGMRHLCIRHPSASTRLRIHAMEVIQLA